MRLDLIFFYEGSIHQFQPEPTQNSLAAEEALSYPSMEHLENDRKDRPSQYKNSHKIWNETGHHVVNLVESQ